MLVLTDMRALYLALLIAFGIGVGARQAAAESRKVAVVVGANLAPTGRVPLRYAHDDATQVAEVLRSVAGFNPRDISVLLDPTPTELLAELDRKLAAAAQTPDETLLFFYYSGHADEHAVFPKGEPLALGALKTRLADPRAKLRLGLLDSCRGGSWTGSKGLKKVTPFAVDALSALTEEGSILIASSTGHGSAHETEALRGSFFTHYWNAGLRGSADRNADGVVTLNEVFEYARELTIRDSALSGQEPQQPSFQMKLSGRRDFPLATLANQHTTLLYVQETGPTEVVRLSDGLVVAESAPGARKVQLALAVGRYLVRRRTSDGLFVRIVSLSAGEVATLTESALERATAGSDRSKAVEPTQLDRLSYVDQSYFSSLALGVRHAPVIDPGLRVGAADGRAVLLLRVAAKLAPKLWWSAPLTLVFDTEQRGSVNWFVWAGVPVLALSRPADGGYRVGGFLGAGVDARLRPSEHTTFNASLSALSAFDFHNTPPTNLAPQVTLGVTEVIPAAVSFNLGAGMSANLIAEGSFSSAGRTSADRNIVFALGSVQRAGLRPLPLIHVPIAAGWAVDAYAVGAYIPARRSWVETYLAGASLAL